MRRRRRLAHILLITLTAAPAAAMIEYGPLAREAAVEAGCVEPEIQRLGNDGAAIIYTMACSPGSAVSDGRIRCELEACQLEDDSPPAGDAETE